MIELPQQQQCRFFGTKGSAQEQEQNNINDRLEVVVKKTPDRLMLSNWDHDEQQQTEASGRRRADRSHALSYVFMSGGIMPQKRRTTKQEETIIFNEEEEERNLLFSTEQQQGKEVEQENFSLILSSMSIPSFITIRWSSAPYDDDDADDISELNDDDPGIESYNDVPTTSWDCYHHGIMPPSRSSIDYGNDDDNVVADAASLDTDSDDSDDDDEENYVSEMDAFC